MTRGKEPKELRITGNDILDAKMKYDVSVSRYEIVASPTK